MKKPFTVKAIRFLALFKMAFLILLALVIFYMASAPPQADTFGYGFGKSIIEALGYQLDTFGAYEAGEIFGRTFLIPITVAGLILFLLARKKRLGIQIVAVFEILFSVVNTAMPMTAIVILILTLLKPTRDYCKAE